MKNPLVQIFFQRVIYEIT